MSDTTSSLRTIKRKQIEVDDALADLVRRVNALEAILGASRPIRIDEGVTIISDLEDKCTFRM